MQAVAIVVFAGTETRADLGRAVNALQVAREFDGAGDEVTVIFDGAGTQWVPEFSKSDHKYHELFEATKGVIAGACAYCAAAYRVKDKIADGDVPLLDEFEGHPSIRKLISNGYQVIPF